MERGGEAVSALLLIVEDGLDGAGSCHIPGSVVAVCSWRIGRDSPSAGGWCTRSSVRRGRVMAGRSEPRALPFALAHMDMLESGEAPSVTLTSATHENTKNKFAHARSSQGLRMQAAQVCINGRRSSSGNQKRKSKRRLKRGAFDWDVCRLL